MVERGVSPPRLVGQYDVIYADPPWTFQTYSVRGRGRGPEARYDCMSLHDIKSLPVDCWASGTAALYLWCTVPHLQNALSVVEAWGFSYKSSFVWVKEKIGTGYWCRNRHELLLVGARGSRICPRFRGIPAADSVIEGQQRAHSQKPNKARQIIERYHPDANKLEMFARERVRGWDSWGPKSARASAAGGGSQMSRPMNCHWSNRTTAERPHVLLGPGERLARHREGEVGRVRRRGQPVMQAGDVPSNHVQLTERRDDDFLIRVR